MKQNEILTKVAPPMITTHQQLGDGACHFNLERKPKSQGVGRGSVMKMSELVKNPLKPPSIYRLVTTARSRWRNWDPFGRWPGSLDLWGRPIPPGVCSPLLFATTL
jgi:hypothetical protein